MVKVEKVSEEYVLTDESLYIGSPVSQPSIRVKIEFYGGEKHVSILTADGNENFQFINSHPALIESIGRLLVEASKL